jgi:hypothetical protein
LAAGFLAAVTIVLLRADVVYIHLHGVPTSQSVLFATKFISLPYDFHYYTLGNPDSTAGFLLLPFALALFWCAAPTTTRTMRWWLMVPIVVIGLTLVLLYVRFEGLIALVMIIGALLASPLPLRLRQAIGACAVLAAVAIAFLSPGHYLLDVFNSGHGSSGAVRLQSLRLGWQTFTHHPWAGVGLGNFGEGSTQLAAHSAIVEAGAETGILGLAGVALATVGLVGGCVRRVRRHGATGLRSAAWIAIAAYAFVCALSGVAAEGTMINFVSVYGLSLGLLAGIALAEPQPTSAGVTVRMFPRRWAAVRLWSEHARIASAVTVVLLGGVALGVSRVLSRHRSTHHIATVGSRQAAFDLLVWNLATLPADWQVATRGIRFQPVLGQSEVTTTARSAAYVLLSPLRSLPAGRYQIVVDGRVVSGELGIGALDVGSRRWVAFGSYPSARVSQSAYPMPIRLTARRTTGLRIVLFNASRLGRSRWTLRSVSLRSLASSPAHR